MRLVLTNTVLQKIAMLLMFCKQNSQTRVFDIPSYPESTIGPTMVGPKEKFQSRASQMAQ